MPQRSNIEWTEYSWNFLRGCSKVSTGCRNCYAIRQAHRMNGQGQAYENLTETDSTGHLNWTGEVRVVEHLIEWPLTLRKPSRIFVNSMSDLFHESVPFDVIDRVFAVMALRRQHVFQILTKRPERMLEYKSSNSEIWRKGAIIGPRNSLRLWPNVWLGVSCENQATADERIPLLLQCPADVRWISAEPLLGPIQLRYDFLPRIESLGNTLSWVVCGAESGPNARPMEFAWARSLRDQCAEAKAPFFMKQLCFRGCKIPFNQWPNDLKIQKYPK